MKIYIDKSISNIAGETLEFKDWDEVIDFIQEYLQSVEYD